MIKALLARPLVAETQQSAHLEIGQRAHVAQRSGKLRLTVFADTANAANQLHAYFGKSVDVECRSIGRACKLQ